MTEDDPKKTQHLTDSEEGGTDMPSGEGGEDEGSSSVDGKDDHLHDDQKPIN